MTAGSPGRTALIALALVCVAALGAGLVSQYVFDLQPCPWCILQRLIFVLVAVLLLAAAFVPLHAGRVFLAGLAILGALSGASAAAYQHFVAAKSTSCNLTLADRIISGLGLDSALPSVFQVRASCADAAVDILGLPFEFYALGLYLLVAAGAALTLRRR